MQYLSKPLMILVLLTILLAKAQAAYAQENLAFYQAKYIVLSGTTTGQNVAQLVDSQNITVAPGHVLKMESRVGSNINDASTVIDEGYVAIDDIIYRTAGPVWLAPGTYKLSLNCTPNSAHPVLYKVAISAVDFRVIK